MAMWHRRWCVLGLVKGYMAEKQAADECMSWAWWWRVATCGHGLHCSSWIKKPNSKWHLPMAVWHRRWCVLGLVKGYMAEKQVADECLRSLENRNEALIKDTERLRARLRVLEDSHEDMAQREQDLAHQQHTLELSVDDASKGMHCYRCVCVCCRYIVVVGRCAV